MNIAVEESLPRRHRMTVSDFYRMGEIGLFAPEARMELIEVSDSSLSYDLGRKAPLYARHGVAEFWVFDIKRRQVHFLRAPHQEGFAKISVISDIGTVPIPQLPDVGVDLSWFTTMGDD